MPAISMFYGIIVYMYYRDNEQHNNPHIHVKYGEERAVFTIKNAEIINGNISKKVINLVKAWINIHYDELMANWELAVNGYEIYKIEPLR